MAKADENATATRPWHAIVHDTLKRNEVRLAVYVPDRVLTPLLRSLHEDDTFTTFAATREEEALGILTGAWMAGMRGALLMIVSERGTLGEFNLGQVLVCRTMRPVLDALGVEHHTITRHDELEFILDRSIKQSIATQAPTCLILSPLLTGGKTFKK